MPFLLAEILNFQGSTHHIGVGSFSNLVLISGEDFMKIIQSSVADGQRIFLRGFGVFQPKERKAKVGRNITRGEQLSIPPKRVPQFRPYPHFKKVVEKGK